MFKIVRFGMEWRIYIFGQFHVKFRSFFHKPLNFITRQFVEIGTLSQNQKGSLQKNLLIVKLGKEKHCFY